MLIELILIGSVLSVIGLILICLVYINAKSERERAYIKLMNAHNECISKLRDDGK